ncbi:MAG: thiamine phosphate synthase [Planctomycetes bacterium]|nr:thiamine phosphate synthase [Planctomycetota bacterium]
MAAKLDRDALRLILVTDGVGDPARVETIVQQVVDGGVRCVQLREPRWTARAMLRCCERLLPLLDAVNGLLLVNDRVDVAATGSAHGAQIGHRSLPPDLARGVVGTGRMLGFSAHDERELDEAAQARCDFALLSPVWPTSSKPGAAFLGVPRAGRLTAAAKLPVAWLGGVSAETLQQVAEVAPSERPVGVAVRSELMRAEDPRAAAELLLAQLQPLLHG